jgi:hypothetical protein
MEGIASALLKISILSHVRGFSHVVAMLGKLEK